MCVAQPFAGNYHPAPAERSSIPFFILSRRVTEAADVKLCRSRMMKRLRSMKGSGKVNALYQT